jgi:hypothetical protein
MACGLGGGLAMAVGAASGVTVAAAVGATLGVGVVAAAGVKVSGASSCPSLHATRAMPGSSDMRSRPSVRNLLNSGIFPIIVLAIDIESLGGLE